MKASLRCACRRKSEPAQDLHDNPALICTSLRQFRAMLIAHLPSGYILHRVTQRRFPQWSCLLGSVLPDFDMALVWTGYLTRHHHLFLTHRPALWLTLFALAWLSKRGWAIGLTAGGLVHMCLDSVAGRINWAWPFGHWELGLIQVPRQPGWWVISFVNHPLFLCELAICLVALSLALKTRKSRLG